MESVKKVSGELQDERLPTSDGHANWHFGLEKSYTNFIILP